MDVCKIDEEDDRYVLGLHTPTIVHKIKVNVYDIWKLVKRDKRIKKKNQEDKFINKFTKVITHEFIHKEISDVMGDLYLKQEEKIIDKIVGRI